MASTHALDNQFWHALNSFHAQVAVGTELAKRYPADMWYGVGLVDNSDAAMSDLRQIVSEGEMVALINPPENLTGWEIIFTGTIDQMVCEQDVLEPVTMDGIVALTADDVPDTMALIEIAQPGPFLPRMIELGRFFGIRQDGKLVAMAGERTWLPGYREISTVCTHPDWQGKGFARRLCRLLVHKNWQDGTVPYLHLSETNTPALRLYESMHFVKRADIKLAFMKRVSP